MRTIRGLFFVPTLGSVTRALAILAMGLVPFWTPAAASTVIDATRTITSVSVQRDFAILYLTPAQSVAPEGCSGVNATLAVTLDVSALGGDKALFAAALAAFHAGARVGFILKGCGADGLPQAIQINVQP